MVTINRASKKVNNLELNFKKKSVLTVNLLMYSHHIVKYLSISLIKFVDVIIPSLQIVSSRREQETGSEPVSVSWTQKLFGR